MLDKSYKSFRVTKRLPLDELQSTLVELTHEPTGARIMHIANQDPENLFCLSFQTLPYSSNGVAHILEHTVLCGSKKFPIKDPFFSMTRRSLNTYMNALTGQDFTCYPASSQVEKDFYNLLEVYLDAVFYPELKPLSFLQEGHRLEFADPKDPTTPLLFQGVVFNEMKGNLSSAESRLWEVITKHLTPDLPYAFDSGGTPKEIPSLTHKELKEFHRKFYHPSRCLFFFYGNLPLEKHLDFIEKNVLQKTEKVAQMPHLPLQKRFSQPVAVTEFYPIAAAESLEKKTWIVFSYLTANITAPEEILALSLLESLLMDTDASVLSKALLQSKLCTAAESVVDVEMSEVPFSFVCKGCEPSAAGGLKKILRETLQHCTFSQEEIEASLHQLEFERTEIGAEGMPFGLTLFFRAGIAKQQGSTPESALLIHSLFKDLRQQAKHPDFFPQLIRKYFLDNPHCVELIFKPDPLLEKKEQEEEEARLVKIRKTLNAEAVVAQSEKLTRYQEEVETQSLDCLPKLTLHDIPASARDFPLIASHEKNLAIFHHACFTNHILYADLIYDLPAIDVKDLPLVSFYVRILTELGCKDRDYAQNLAYQQAYTGSFNASVALHTASENPEIYHPAISLRGKALARNTEKLFSLFADTCQGAALQELPRIKELLEQHATALQNKLSNNALNYAVQTSLKGFSSSSFVYDQWHGLTYYKAVLHWLKHPERLAEELARLQKQILGRGKPHLVMACDQEQFKGLQKHHFFGLAEKLPTHDFTAWKNPQPTEKGLSHVRFLAAPVAFTARGMRTIGYHDARAPFLLLACELLDNCILHKEVREKGGAYGSGASYAPHTGNFYLFSFRDPNFSKTIDTFQKALEKIGSGKFTEQDLEEAKFGVIQTLDAPVAPGNRAIAAYAWKRAGRTLEERQLFRKQVLKATKEEILAAVQDLLLKRESCLVSLLGEDLYKKEQKKLKSPLPAVPIS